MPRSMSEQLRGLKRPHQSWTLGGGSSQGKITTKTGAKAFLTLWIQWTRNDTNPPLSPKFRK
eukprot:2156746-Amphidinium_carterae.1